MANYRLEELRQGRELERTIQRGLSQAAAVGDSDAIAALASDAALGPDFESAADRYDRHLAEMTREAVVVARPPSFTSMAEDHGPGSGIYQLTSALAHRREWAIYELTTGLGDRKSTGPGTGTQHIQLSTGWALGVTRQTLEAIAGARNALAAYMGVPLNIHLFVDPTTSLVI